MDGKKERIRTLLTLTRRTTKGHDVDVSPRHLSKLKADSRVWDAATAYSAHPDATAYTLLNHFCHHLRRVCERCLWTQGYSIDWGPDGSRRRVHS